MITEKEIDELAETLLGSNSSTDSYKGWVEGFKYAVKYLSNKTEQTNILNDSNSFSCCLNCKWFLQSEGIDKDFIIGTCIKSPCEVSDMKSNEMAIMCVHDGPIFVGCNFGCINYEKMDCKHNWFSISITGKLHCTKCNEIRD